MSKEKTLSVVIPIYNGATVLKDTVQTISRQKFHNPIKIELVLVNDGSKDNSWEVILEIQKDSPFPCKTVNNIKNLGISAACNAGIKAASGEYIAVMQADLLFEEENSLEKMVEQIDSGVIGTYPYVLHPKWVWDTYPFWQKALFDRLINTRSEARFAKLGLAKRETFEKVGLYEEELSSGEDRDMLEKMSKLGKVMVTDTNVIHIHSKEKTFSIMRLLDKEAQEAEGAGASIKRYGIKKEDILTLILLLTRPIMAISLFIPFFWPVLAIFVFLYTKNLYKYCRNQREIFVLPFVTIARLWVYSYYLVKGLITGKAIANHFKW